MKKKFLIFISLVFLLAAMPLDVWAMSTRQKQVLNSGIPYYNVDSCGGGSVAPGSCAALAAVRQEIAATMSDADKVNLYKRVSVENASSDAHKKAMMETIFNRTLSWNMGSIQCVVAANDDNSDCSGKNAAGYWGSSWPSGLPGDRADWDRIFDEVVGGSNFTNFADGNASYATSPANWNERFVNATGCALPSGKDTCEPMPTSIGEVKTGVEYYMRHASQSQRWDKLIEDCGASGGASSMTSSCVSEAAGNFLDDRTWIYYNQCETEREIMSWDACSTGCLPTSVAMIIANLMKDSTLTPKAINDETGGRLRDISVTSTDVAVAFITSFRPGFRTQALNNITEAKQALQNGALILGNVYGAESDAAIRDANGNGHFFVVRGVTADGMWKIADPNASTTDAKGNTRLKEFTEEDVDIAFKTGAGYANGMGATAIYYEGQ
ncbi:C39 family peptidase [Candidatus Saccharibacteria bacterium]|nr:C39 family peptidase [Candidatus Saccharibacteria bacterium]